MNNFVVFHNTRTTKNCTRNAFIDKVTKGRLPFVEFIKRNKYVDIYISLEYCVLNFYRSITFDQVSNFLDSFIKNKYKKRNLIVSDVILVLNDIDLDIVDEVALKLSVYFYNLINEDIHYQTIEGGF